MINIKGLYQKYMPQSGKQTISIGENKKTQLLNNDDSLSGSRSKVKVRTNNETKSLPRSDKYLSDPGVNRKTYITGRLQYAYSYTVQYSYRSSARYKDSGSKSYNYTDWVLDDAGPFWYSELSSDKKYYIKGQYYVTAKHYYTASDSYTYYYYDYYYYTDYDYYTVSNSGYYYYGLYV